MVIIFSSHSDGSTDLICMYLSYINKIYIRYNEEFCIDNSTYELSNNEILTKIIINKDHSIYFKENEKIRYYYRKGLMNFSIGLNYHTEINKYLTIEKRIFSYYLINQVNSVSSYFTEVNNNKILNLKTAINVGLRIPSTLITSSKKDLMRFISNNKNIITKPLSNSHISFFEKKNYYHSGGTLMINKENIDSLDDYFHLSYFQQYIPKEFEIRIFVFEHLIFAAAILSQFNEKTKIDFRADVKSTRIVPFTLPRMLENKIRKLLTQLGLKTASLDFIYSTDGKYYFLELNPNGMFKFISDECNYHIEKLIAEAL